MSDEQEPPSRWRRALQVADFGCNTLLVVVSIMGLLAATPLMALSWSQQ